MTVFFGKQIIDLLDCLKPCNFWHVQICNDYFVRPHVGIKWFLEPLFVFLNELLPTLGILTDLIPPVWAFYLLYQAFKVLKLTHVVISNQNRRMIRFKTFNAFWNLNVNVRNISNSNILARWNNNFSILRLFLLLFTRRVINKTL